MSSKWALFIIKIEPLEILAKLIGDAFLLPFMHVLTSASIVLQILLKKKSTLLQLPLIESRLLPFVAVETLVFGQSVVDIRKTASQINLIYYGVCLIFVYLIAYGLMFLVSYVEKKEFSFLKEDVEAIAEE